MTEHSTADAVEDADNGEECDDSNTADGDGCSSGCQSEGCPGDQDCDGVPTDLDCDEQGPAHRSLGRWAHRHNPGHLGNLRSDSHSSIRLHPQYYYRRTPRHCLHPRRHLP